MVRFKNCLIRAIDSGMDLVRSSGACVYSRSVMVPAVTGDQIHSYQGPAVQKPVSLTLG